MSTDECAVNSENIACTTPMYIHVRKICSKISAQLFKLFTRQIYVLLVLRLCNARRRLGRDFNFKTAEDFSKLGPETGGDQKV